MDIFRKLHEDGMTVLLVTHEMDIARQAERIIRVTDGKILTDQPNKPEGGREGGGN